MQLTTPIHVSWKVQEEPEQRYLTSGAEALSDRELVGLVLNDQDLATTLFTTFGNLHAISQATTQELHSRCAISLAQIRSLQTAFALSHRMHLENLKPLVISSSQQAASYLQAKIGQERQEVFYVLYLNARNAIVAEERLFVGGTSSTIVDTKLVFKQAVNYLANSILVAHNHPSGRVKPSAADIRITRKLVASGKLLDVRILDHIIVSASSYYSFADEGLLTEGEEE